MSQPDPAKLIDMKLTRTCILAALLSLALPALAADKMEASHAPVNVTIPETADALWTEIDARFKALSGIVANKRGDAVVVASETVEALVNALPAKQPDLAPDKKKRVEGQARNVARVLDELHDAAGEGHWDVAAKKLTQVEVALKIIRQQVAR